MYIHTAGKSQVPTQQEKPSEKQEWFKLQKERLQASKIQDKVRNPVDDMFGKKIAVAQSPLQSAPQSKPQQTVSQDVICTTSAELSNCNLSEEKPGSPCEDSRPEKGTTVVWLSKFFLVYFEFDSLFVISTRRNNIQQNTGAIHEFEAGHSTNEKETTIQE